MRKLLSLLFICLAVFANARQITSDEAATIATDFLNSSVSVQKAGTHVNVRRAQSKKASQSSEETQPYYVFNGDKDGGFVIISGDDRARKILGYSDKGNFDFNNLPPQLAAMLDQYAEQIKALPASADTDPSWSTTSVAPASTDGVLLETANWGQGYPYNLQIPIIDGEHCPTGCVATAMAIVMKYHNWPEKGRGEYHYDLWSNQISANFGECSYSYNLMPLNSLDYTNSDQVASVGTLMFHAGVSVNMTYYQGGSGAFVYDIPYALKDYFRYSTDCQLISKTNFSDEEWLSIIKNQLDNKQPVIYSGENEERIGHAWVVDGYDNTGYFHCNFGWDGAANGYFTILSLSDPAYVLEYNTRQSMVINISPDYDNSSYEQYSRATVENPIHRAYSETPMSSGLMISTDNIELNEPFDVYVNTLGMPVGFCGKYGIGIVDTQQIIKEVLWECPIVCEYGRRSFLQPAIPKVIVHSPFDNTDRIFVITKSDDEEYWKLVPGTIDAPSNIPVYGNVVDLCKVHFNIDPSLKLYIGKTWDSLTENDIWDSDKDFEVLYDWWTIHFKLSPNDQSPDKIITFDVDGSFNGELMNKVRMKEFEKDIAEGFFKAWGSEITFTATYEEPIDLKIEMTQAGQLYSLLTERQARIVRKLELSGPMNVHDMWYINDYFQSLTDIDISNVEFKEVDLENVFFYNSIVAQTQNADQIPDFSFFELKRLNKVLLPSTIKAIGMNFLDRCRLKEIEIPIGVERIYNNFMCECINLEKIEVLNPVPPVFTVLSGNFCYEAFENAILYVPEESVETYRNAPVWKDFKNIYAIGTILPQRIEFDEPSITLGINESKTLQVSFFPENSDITDLRWESDNVDVVTVSEDGTITGLNYGSTFVHAYTTNNKIADCLVFVEKILVNQIILTPEYLSGKVGDNLQILAQIFPVNTENKTINWTTSDTTIASVRDDGLVTLLKEGTCNITATATDGSGVSATCTVTVIPTLAESIALNHESAQLKVGESIALEATVLPESATDKSVTWNSSDEAVATVDVNGKVTAVSLGEAIITASATDGSGVSATCTVIVIPTLAESLTIDPESWAGVESETFQITAEILPENTTDKTLVWTSSDTSIATVDNTGLVSVLKKGLCTISASTTDGSNLTAECKLDVSSVIEEIFADGAAMVDVYNTQGVLIKKNCTKQELNQLAAGIYIIRSTSETIKVLIK